MAFLAPLFLFGALAIGAPILFHLIRRHTKEVVPFSSLMFLRPTPPRVHRRSTLENLWLLLLRCLALILIALCFARPFIKRQDVIGATQDPSRRTVLLVDVSGSMQRPDLWSAAVTKTQQLVEAAGPTDQMALFAFDRSPSALVGFDEWARTAEPQRAELVRARLATVKPGHGVTSLGAAMLQGLELLEEIAPVPGLQREIVVVSDLQDGSKLDGLQGRTWPADLKVRLETIAAPEQVNGSVAWITGGGDVEPSAADEKLLLRVSNSPRSTREQFKLQRTASSGVVAATSDAYVPAGQSRLVRLPPVVETDTAGESITLTGDEVPFDNQLFVLPRKVVRFPVLFRGNETAENPAQSVFYMQRAFATMRRQEIVLQIQSGDAVPSPADLLKAEMFVLGDGVTREVVESARQFAERGRTVIFPLTSAASGAVLQPLLGAAVPTTEAELRNYALLAQIQFQHPFFAPFADPRFSDFAKIHFWKHRVLDLTAVNGANVLAQFDSGAPAVVQVPIGKGSAVIFASSWRPVDSQLALSTKFVPLLNSILEQSNRLPESRVQYLVGDEVQVSVDQGPVSVRKPDGTEVPVTDGRFAGTDQPGIYNIAGSDVRFAVNLHPEESRLAPLPHDRLTSLGVPLLAPGDASAGADAAKFDPEAQAMELESRQKLWRWLLAAAFVILLVETWLAGRLARPAPAQA
jgi:hypothetical protein